LRVVIVMQVSSQFSAAQALEAAQRAEAEGRLDYAIQVYRHVSDHHQSARVGSAARAALARIGVHRAAPARASPPASARRPAQGTSQPAPARSESLRRSSIKIAPAGSTNGRRSLVLPRARQEYQIGLALAHTGMAAGCLLAVAGVTLTVLYALRASAWAAAPLWKESLAQPWTGPALIGAALGLVFVGQLARAVFDTAGALRELLAVERAKAEHLNSQAQR
jgi:hypothetical protein